MALTMIELLAAASYFVIMMERVEMCGRHYGKPF